MTDASLIWGGDLAVTSSGDISLVSGPVATQQRILRRLLTNKNDYTWAPTYGGGLGQFVGQPQSGRVVEGAIRSQIFLETAVAHQPEPVIETDIYGDGSVIVYLSYVDKPSNSSQTLTFQVGV